MGTDVLKLLILPLLLIACVTPQMVHAQDEPLLYKEIQLDKKTYTFDELTHAIQQQTGITFSYNASKISADRSFHIKAKRITAIKLLAIIKDKSGIGYKVVHPGLIIYKPTGRKPTTHKKSKRKKKTKTVVKATPTITTNALAKATASPDKPPVIARAADSSSQTVVVIGDSATASDFYFGGAGGSGAGGSMGTIKMVMRYPGKNDNVLNPYASLNPPGGEHQTFSSNWQQKGNIAPFFKKNFLMAGGFSTSETYYFSPVLHFGFRFLYADLSYNVGAYSQFRYGLGAEAQINDKWAIQAGFNTGESFSESYVNVTFDSIFLPPPDSLSPPPPPIVTEITTPISVESKLLCFSLSAVRKVNKNLTLSGGLVLNRLSTQYFSNDQPFDLTQLEPPVLDADNRFRTLKPPYELSRSYSPADARLTQLWVGFRIGIFYRLSFSD